MAGGGNGVFAGGPGGIMAGGAGGIMAGGGGGKAPAGIAAGGVPEVDEHDGALRDISDIDRCVDTDT